MFTEYFELLPTSHTVSLTQNGLSAATGKVHVTRVRLTDDKIAETAEKWA